MEYNEITNWASDVVKIIEVTQDVSNLSYKLRVRQFVPQEDDSLQREWKTQGVKHSYPCANFAIENMAETGEYLKGVVNASIEPSIDHYLSESDSFLSKTYRTALKYSVDLERSDEQDLLKSVLRFWVSMRMESRSERICGTESLGMQPQNWDRGCNNYNQILMPPVISAQIELMMTVAILQPLSQSVLKSLLKLIEKGKAHSWLTIYLSLFILLHSCALLTEFENRQARKYGLETRYVNDELVKELHRGADILLIYFHYRSKGGSPLQVDLEASDIHRAGLNSELVCFLRESREHMKAKANYVKSIRKQKVFEDPYWFISQLYDAEWESIPTI
ncbi:hypothetical protein BX600DRAFT_506269 [Xylariales sp. PMI_506]|nr:hypothetical protein BX600DRAFT_506269 [Xylariales sp. PMI_506]